MEVNDVSGTVGWAHKHIGVSDYQRAFLVANDVSPLSLGLFPLGNELPGFTGQALDGTWNSAATSVNGCRQVVGQAQNSSGAYRAFLYQSGATALTDLTSLAPSGWVLTSAVGISDSGHIVGSGSHNSATRQWMMYPTPQE